MNDSYAAAVQFIVLLMSLGASTWLGWRLRGPRTSGRIMSSLVLALLIGFLFTYLAVYANEFCRKSSQLCPERGDGNMSYWFFPFFAVPIHLFLLLAFGEREEPYTFVPSPFDKVVDSALAEWRNTGKTLQRCPDCKSILSIERQAVTASVKHQRLNVWCACNKCDRLFELDGTALHL